MEEGGGVGGEGGSGGGVFDPIEIEGEKTEGVDDGLGFLVFEGLEGGEVGGDAAH